MLHTGNDDGDDDRGNTSNIGMDDLQEPLLPNRPEVTAKNGSTQQGQNFDLEDNSSTTSIETASTHIVDGLPWRLSYLIKSLYFLEALSSSTWGRFATLYYNAHGFNPAQIGWLEGCMTLIPAFCLPVWGWISDVYQCRKAVYIGTKVVSTLLLLTLALPNVYHSIAKMFTMSCLTKLFVSGGILDTYTLQLLGTKNKLMYGRYRLYASLSWALGAIIMGYSTDHYGFEPNFIYYGFLAILSLTLSVWKIPNDALLKKQSNDANNNNRDANGQVPEEEKEEEDDRMELVPPEEDSSELIVHSGGQQSDDINDTNINSPMPPPLSARSQSSLYELASLFLQPKVLLFLGEVVVMGAGMATVERFLFLYMVNDLKTSNLLCGLGVGVLVIFEFPLFRYATQLKKYCWGGLDGLQAISMICFVVRTWGYTQLTPSTKWWILALESLHGLTFACFWITLTDVCKALIHLTNDKWSTTIPLFVQMLSSAVGAGLGSVIGGWAMHRYGARQMYFGVSVIVSIFFILHCAGCIVTRCYNGTRFLPDYDDAMAEESSESNGNGDNDEDESNNPGQFRTHQVEEQEATARHQHAE